MPLPLPHRPLLPIDCAAASLLCFMNSANVIQMSTGIYYEWCDSDYEPANILVRSLSEHEQLNFAPKFWTNKKNLDSNCILLNFFHWSRANMDWTIDICGDNHNCQVGSLKWTLNHVINGFHGLKKYVLAKENHRPYAYIRHCLAHIFERHCNYKWVTTSGFLFACLHDRAPQTTVYLRYEPPFR